MFSIPNPLHPAVVHFPIVLLLLGAAVAVSGVFVNRWHLAWVAAGLLGLGAVGCFFAVKSGDAAKESAGEPSPTVEALVDAHEKWAERTEIVGAVAAALAIGAAVLGAVPASRRRKEGPTEKGALHSNADWITPGSLALTARVWTAVAALTGCFLVYQTASRGGDLVYVHGVGVKAGSAQVPRSAPAEDN